MWGFGTNTTFNMVFRRLNKMLVDKGIEEITYYRYEEFEGSHSGIESRLDYSLRLK